MNQFIIWLFDCLYLAISFEVTEQKKGRLQFLGLLLLITSHPAAPVHVDQILKCGGGDEAKLGSYFVATLETTCDWCLLSPPSGQSVTRELIAHTTIDR